MLPAALVTLLTFLLDLTNSSPVYNMQPAFITRNIGFTSGRNIRNLPCVSRKNQDLSGVCMFAIDCMKANGTHLGTCIDRFYFGSCCHVEPNKEIETNIIETDIILDSRVPPHRVQNKTTQSSLSSTSTSSSTPSLLSNESSSSPTTQSILTTITSSHPSIISSTMSSSSIPQPSSTMRPFGEKISQNSSSSTTSTTETTTTAQKLQTFQIVDGALVEATTTIKPVQAVTKKPTKGSTQIINKSPTTTSRPKPTISTSARPSKPSTFTSKPITKPTKTSKPTRKSTPKPTKPVRTSSTTRRPTATTTKTSSTRKPPTSKPTRRVTKPTVNATTAKPTSASSKRPQTTTVKVTKKPSIITKKPLTSITTSPTSTITERTTTISPRPTSIPESALTVQVSTSTPTTSTPSATTSSSVISTYSSPSSVEVISKKNVTQILESSTINLISNEILDNSTSTTSTTSTSAPSTSSATEEFGTKLTTTSTMKPVDISSSLSTDSPKEEVFPSTVNITTAATSTRTSTSTTTPSSIPGVWTIDDPKNHTIASIDNGTLIIGNITEEWTPITTPDGWVLLPSVAPSTIAAGTIKNETSTPTTTSPSTISPPPSVEPVTNFEPVTAFVPVVTLAPETSTSTTTMPSPTQSSDLTSSSTLAQETTVGSVSVQETTSSSVSAITSIVTSTSEGEKITTSMPSITTVSNVTVTEDDGAGGSSETSSMATSTEYVPESKPVNMSDFTEVCGRRMWPEARIVGGEKSAFGKWPWQISLRQWRTSTYLHKCGAALLNENWAITAAHCVDNVPPNDLLLRLGEHDLSTEGEPFLYEDRRVQIVASHPQFDPRTFEYDLALLRFYEPVVFQPNILPVCVPTKDESFVGRNAYVTGWGRLYEDGPLPSVLQEVSVPVINNTVCESMYRSAGYIEHIPHIFICAGWRRGGFDSCEGDSGGPMVIQREDNRFLLAGVISWGIGCAEPNQPGVYTRISEFREWINQILQF